jgi:hypothetical protein
VTSFITTSSTSPCFSPLLFLLQLWRTAEIQKKNLKDKRIRSKGKKEKGQVERATTISLKKKRKRHLIRKSFGGAWETASLFFLSVKQQKGVE